MSEMIHAHLVMEKVLAEPRKWTRAALAGALAAEFGSKARYRTCSAEGLSAEELIELLLSKGKLRGTEAALEFAHGKACAHTH